MDTIEVPKMLHKNKKLSFRISPQAGVAIPIAHGKIR